jgi:hypothetical protein
MRRIISLFALACFGFFTTTAMGSAADSGQRQQRVEDADDDDDDDDNNGGFDWSAVDVNSMVRATSSTTGFNECFSPGGRFTSGNAPRADRSAEAVSREVTSTLEGFVATADGINSLFIAKQAGGHTFSVWAKAIEQGEGRRLAAVFSTLLGDPWNASNDVEALAQLLGAKITELAPGIQLDHSELTDAIRLAKL